jgi:hypothetical protein
MDVFQGSRTDYIFNPFFDGFVKISFAHAVTIWGISKGSLLLI